MASSTCQTCLLHASAPYATISRSIPRTLRVPKSFNAFSTSANAQFPMVPKGTGVKFQKKAKDHGKTGKPPASGERKATRKRIVLSNTNALEVPGMMEITPEALMEKDNIGKVFALPGKLVDSLRAVEAFKTTQPWGMFRKPGVLIRQDSVRMAWLLETAEQQKITRVYILDGPRASGKSMMLLQAIAAAFMNNWVVLHIPEVQELTTASTDYSPVKGTNPTQYSQNEYAAKWLEQIHKANPVLSSLRISKPHNLPIILQPKDTLARLCEIGGREPDAAWPVFQAFWEEITLPGRPPVLMSLDGLNRACRESDYRDPNFKLIHAQDLAIFAHFFTYFSGKKTLPNGGVVLGATTCGNAPENYALDLTIKQKREARDAGRIVTQIDPFKPIIERDYRALQHAKLFRVDGLSKDEARGLMEYWASSGVLRATIDEKTVVEKWALAGNGIVGEIERGALRMRI